MTRPWHAALADGTVVPLAFIKVDLADSTGLEQRIGKEAASLALKAFRSVVEVALRGIEALPDPPQWAGDGQAFVVGGARPVAAMVEAAFVVLECVRLIPGAELHVRFAIGFDDAEYQARVGTIKARDFDLAGHLEAICPRDSIILTEEAWQALRSEPELQAKFEYFGMRKDDRCPGYVAPLGRRVQDARNQQLLVPAPEDTHASRRELLDLYEKQPSFRLIRFVGVRQFERVGGVELLEAFRPLRVRSRSSAMTWWAPEMSVGLAAAEEATLTDEALDRNVSERREDFRSVLRSFNRVVTLGDPGSGKSTLLRWLTLVAAQGRRATRTILGIDEQLLPLHFSVGRLADLVGTAGNNAPLATLEAYYRGLGVEGIGGVIEEALENGSAFLLFDGLDEVPSATERRAVERFIEGLCARHGRCRSVVTSRIVGYVPIAIPEAETWTIEPLDEDSSLALAEAFYTAYYRVEHRGDEERAIETGRRAAASLIQALSARRTLQHFRENPLLLTLAALVHTQMGKLPRYRARLYQVVAQTLIEAWTTARLAVPMLHAPRPIDYDLEGLAVFPPLALMLHDNHANGLIAEPDLLEFIEARLQLPRTLSDLECKRAALDLLVRTSSGGSILVERGEKTWGFLHLSIQEYLAAKALAGQEELRERFLRDRLYDPRYEEIWRLVAGEIGIVHESPPSAGRFVGSILRDGNRVHAQILHKNVLLAAECLADTSTADRGLVDTVVEGLSRLATAHENRRLLQKSHDVLRDWSALSEASDVAARLASHLGSRDRAVRLCALEGLERLGVPDRHRAALLLSDDDPAVRARAARWLALEPDDEAIDRILEAYSIERDSIAQIELCSLLGELGSPRAIDALAKSLKGPAHVAAAYALLSCGGRQVLMEALQRRHPLAARGAAKALGDAGERAIAPLLAAIIQESSDARLVLTAAHGLIDLAIPGASDLIRAVVDDTSRPTEVRSMGAMALARVADVEDAPRLLGLVTGGHQRMRYDAARALGRINDPQVVAKLSEIARDGSEPSDVRMAALTSLGTLRSAFGFAEFTSILRDDADPCARAAAAWALAEVRLPFAVPELLTALEGDESLAVQMAASHALSVIAHADIIPRVEAILDGTHEFDRSFLALRVLGSHDAARAITRIVDHGDMDSPITAMLQVADAPRTRGELLWDLSLEAP